MRESILLFHISDKEVKKKVERALLPLRVRIRHIALKDYSQPLGMLAGLPDMTPSEETYDGEELSDTMIVFCGLSSQKLDQALHPLLDELLALFGGMGQVIAVVNEGMLIVKIGGGLWLRKHSGIS